VFVIGPESSGSMLIAKICSHVLDIQGYDKWNGVAWSDRGMHKVCHRSLPYGDPPKFPNLERWILENETNYELYFILTTRDIFLSERSRFRRWEKSFQQSQAESAMAKEIISNVIKGGYPFFIWSYETFMYLERAYLECLYRFLGVESNFIPMLFDGNRSQVNICNY